jgi:hypothetical protein
MCWIASQAKTVNRRGVPTPNRHAKLLIHWQWRGHSSALLHSLVRAPEKRTSLWLSLDGGLSPRVSRRVTLGQLCGKRTAEGVKVVADALVEGNGNAKTIATRKRK